MEVNTINLNPSIETTKMKMPAAVNGEIKSEDSSMDLESNFYGEKYRHGWSRRRWRLNLR